jgi:hypothetical protein
MCPPFAPFAGHFFARFFSRYILPSCDTVSHEGKPDYFAFYGLAINPLALILREHPAKNISKAAADVPGIGDGVNDFQVE